MKKNERARRMSGSSCLGIVVVLSLLVGCGEKDTTKPDNEIVIPTASIVVDGMRGDWVGIEPVATDGSGDDGSGYSCADLKALYIAQSAGSDTIYAMLEFWNGPPNPDMASATSTDGDEQHPDVELGYQIAINPWHGLPPIAELFGRFDPQDNKWYQWYTGTPAAVEEDGVLVVGGDVVEFRFAATVIGRPIRCIVGASTVCSAYPYGGPHPRDYVPDTPEEPSPGIRFR